MRVSTNMMFSQGLAAMQKQQARISEAQNEISSGKKNLTPDKDGVGFAKASNLEVRNSQLTQYQRNIDFARGKLELQEGVLGQSTDALQRIKEVAISAGNSFKLGEDANAPSRQALIDELAQMRDVMMGLANTRDERGEYVFSGTAATVAPLQVDGSLDPDVASAQPVSTRIADNREVEIYRSAEGVFSAGGGSVVEAIDTMIAAIEAGDMDGILAAQGEVDDIMDNVVTARGKIGNSLNVLDRSWENNDVEMFANTKLLADLRDTDYADAITRLNQSMMVLQATQQTISKTQSLSLFDYIR